MMSLLWYVKRLINIAESFFLRREKITITYLNSENNDDLVDMAKFVLSHSNIEYINDPIDESLFALISELSTQQLPMVSTGDLVLTSPQSALRYISRLVCNPPTSIREEFEVEEWTDRGFNILQDDSNHSATLRSIEAKLQSSYTGWIMNTITPCKADFLWGFILSKIEPQLLGDASKHFLQQFKT